MSATEDLKIALNVLSRVGLDGDLMGEYAKAKAMTHGLDSYNALQAQQAMTQQPVMPPTAPTGQAIPPQENMAETPPMEQPQGAPPL